MKENVPMSVLWARQNFWGWFWGQQYAPSQNFMEFYVKKGEQSNLRIVDEPGILTVFSTTQGEFPRSGNLPRANPQKGSMSTASKGIVGDL